MGAVKDAQPKRVLVIGAGAAGTSCAWSLSRFPERFRVEVWESEAFPGGAASSCKVKDGVTINDQVQGGASSYRHNLRLLSMFGFKVTPVAMRIAFGQGDKQWTNHSPSGVTERLRPEIQRFGKLLKWITRFEPIFIMLPISKVLKWFGFSEAFATEMVFPLTALFFGTGNQTPHVAAAVIARVFLDPDLRLFDYSPDRLLDSVPEMFAFPVLQDVFTTIADRSDFALHCKRPVRSVVRTPTSVVVEDAEGKTQEFDEVVFACNAEVALKILKHPSWLERRLLSNVKYFDDYCVTHEDSDYMQKMYDVRPEQRDNYFVRQYEGEPEKIEMSFNICTYQPHLRTEGQADIFQTYYLDAACKDTLWSDKEVDPSKVLCTRWMRQMAHTWRHFAFFVPWGRFLQGRQHTWFCGSYTLFNTQEIAVMSGLAVAERLGASYPFADDPAATKQFDMFLGVAHGVKRRPEASAGSSAHAGGGVKAGAAHTAHNSSSRVHAE